MVLHEELLLVGQMVVNTTLAEHGKDPVVIAQENVAKLLLAAELFELFRLNFLSVFVDEPEESRETLELIN